MIGLQAIDPAMEDGYPDDLSHACLPLLYKYYREWPDYPWPEKVLPLFVMGCGYIDSIDCSAAGLPVVRWVDQALEPSGIPLYDWMDQWATRMELKQIR